MPRIYLSPPDISAEDHAAVDDVLTSNWVAPVGPDLRSLEDAVSSRVGIRHAAALNSGTAALHLALKILGIGPGDKVICPTLTFAASANPICYQGAEPIFIDCEASSWNLDPDLLSEALLEHPETKAVIVVHLYGQCADMSRILNVCKEFEITVIEDAAEALGASYQGKPAGSFGDMSFFSFNGNKIITTSGGGMLLSNSEEWIQQAVYLATQAREPVAHYEHREIGYNYRMSNVLAGLGVSQMKDLDRRISSKRKHFEAYSTALSDWGVSMMPLVDPDACNYWLSCLTVDSDVEPSQIIAALEAADIEARPIWKPLHKQPVYFGCQVYGGSVAEDLFARGLCLPSGSGMSEAERDSVIDVLRSVLEGDGS